MGLFDGITNAISSAASSVGKFVSGNVGSLIGGGAQLLGGLLTNEAQADQAQNAMNFSAQQSQAQMDFQERMRRTQYQTAVEDLKAAGLNPMLAYMHGGAGTPSGSAAVGQQANMRNPADNLAGSASMIANIRADLDKKEAETVESISRTGVNDEQRKLLNAQTILAILEAPNVSERTKQIAAETLLANARVTATNAEETAIRLDTMIRTLGDVPEAKAKGSYFTNAPYNPFYIRDVKDVSQSVSSAVGAANLSNIFKPNDRYRQPMPSRR